MWRFLGIGAQKSGTTWLYEQLRRHPGIGFPLGKEAHFWDRLAGPDSIPRYISAFSSTALSEGDITPAYALLKVPVIERIHDASPGLRLIYLMRNPVERAWSSALMALARAEMTIDEASDAWFLDHFRSSGSLGRGDYATCIRNWRSVFPSEQLLLVRFERIVSEPEHVLRGVCRHIGVADPRPGDLARCRKRVFVGLGHAIRPQLREALEMLYRPRITELEDLLAEDFSGWLSHQGGTG